MSFLSRIFSKKREPLELPPEFQQSEPPDWLLELKGVDLAGRAFSVRVQLQQDAREGSADVFVLPSQSGEEPQSASAPLLRPELDRLFIILGFSFPNDFENVPNENTDGLPVTLTIHRHQPYAFKVVECNLADWMDSKRTRPPAVDVSTMMIEISKRALPPK